jgi:TrmH family RNA methyltransferase
MMKQVARMSRSTFKSVLKLTQKKFRKAERKFLIEGSRLVEEALKSDWAVEMLMIAKPMLEGVEGVNALNSAQQKHIPIYEISEEELRKLSETVTSQGVLAVVSMKEQEPEAFWSSLPRQSVIVGFDGISDPGNAGTMLRTCDWFGVNGVLIDRNGVELYSPKVTRSAMGSIFHLPVLTEIDLLQSLRFAKNLGYQVFITTSSGEAGFPSTPFPDKTMFIFGNEAHGVSPGIMREADGRVSIPKFGKAESLNVAIACGVILGTLRLSAAMAKHNDR